MTSRGGAIVALMNADTTSFANRFDRFVRWFFTASPTAVEPPRPPVPKVARRAESRRPAVRLRAHHAGPVRVAAKAKS